MTNLHYVKYVIWPCIPLGLFPSCSKTSGEIGIMVPRKDACHAFLPCCSFQEKLCPKFATFSKREAPIGTNRNSSLGANCSIGYVCDFCWVSIVEEKNCIFPGQHNVSPAHIHTLYPFLNGKKNAGPTYLFNVTCSLTLTGAALPI